MHAGAFEFVGRFSTCESISVIEIGSRDINGTVRVHFPEADWIGLDLHPGPFVDVVVDAMVYTPQKLVDLVVCCEVFEHASHWREMLKHAATWLKPRGKIIITCAGEGRAPHSAIDGGPLRAGEHYANIDQVEMGSALSDSGFAEVATHRNEHWKDTYAVAVKQ